MPLRNWIMSAARGMAVVSFYAVCLPLLWLAEPFFGVRIGLLYTQRIGHLAANTDVFFRALPERDKGKRRTYLLTGWDPANRQLFEMFKRDCGIIESQFLTWYAFACREKLKRTRFWQPLPFDATEYKLYNTTSPVISFTDDEEHRGREALAAMGIGHDDWFVGFHARDAAYLDKWRPEHSSFWRSKDFKNADITTYLKAAEHIAGQGGYALRMGAVVERPLPQPIAPGVIDYATQHRSDFMDIFIAARSRFFLASSTGLGHVPTVFGRPVIVANHWPYNHSHYRKDDLIVPRPILDPDTGDVVPFSRAQADDFFAFQAGITSDGINKHLYQWGYNDEQDILNGVLDMLDILEGREAPEGALEIQQAYARKYLSHLPDYELAAKLSPRYALRHQELI